MTDEEFERLATTFGFAPSGPEVDEWDRWHAVAKVAAAQVEAEREACARVCDDLADISGHYAIAATAIRKRGEE